MALVAKLPTLIGMHKLKLDGIEVRAKL